MRDLFLLTHLRPLLDELRHDAHGDFGHGLRFNFDSDGALHARHFFRRGDFRLDEVLGNRPPFARAADHAEELKRAVNPAFQHERVVLVAARDDEAERGRRRERLGAKLAPVAGAQ